MQTIDWDELESIATRMSQASLGPGSMYDSEWQQIQNALQYLYEKKDWEGVIRLRELFAFLIIGETTGGIHLIRELNEKAREGAEKLRKFEYAARYLHDSGQNFHRQGYHEKAIESFKQSSKLYQDVGKAFQSLESHYMTALCYRAIGNHNLAKQTLNQVLQESIVVPIDKGSWRGNPLQVMAWLAKDENQWDEAERLLRQALTLFEQYDDPSSVQVAQVLADLGEVLGYKGQYDDAKVMFHRSLSIISKFSEQYNRQEARTKLKFAEMLIQLKHFSEAIQLLNEADDKIRVYGHYYDLMWRIELSKANIFFKQGKWGWAMRKFRVALLYRQELKLSNVELFKKIIKRKRSKAG